MLFFDAVFFASFTTLRKPIDSKYADYINRAMKFASAAIGSGERLIFNQGVAPDLIGGWAVSVGGNSVNHTHATMFSALKSGDAEFEF